MLVKINNKPWYVIRHLDSAVVGPVYLLSRTRNGPVERSCPVWPIGSYVFVNGAWHEYLNEYGGGGLCAQIERIRT